MKILPSASKISQELPKNEWQCTLAIIKPDAFLYRKAIIREIKRHGLKVLRMRIIKMKPKTIRKLYKNSVGKPYFKNLMNLMTEGRSCILKIGGHNAVEKWRALIGPNTLSVKVTHPNSLRAKFGTNCTRNAVHGSDSVKNAEIELSIFF